MGEKEYQNLPNEPAKFHFDFKLNAIEAETLFSAINRERVDCLKNLVTLHAKRVPSAYPGPPEGSFDAYKAWYEARIEFLQQLEDKLTFEEEEA